MKKIAILLILFATLSNLSAQYYVAYKQAKAQEKEGLYYKAILSYNAAAISRDKPATNDVSKRIDYCANKLNELKTKAEKAQAAAEKATLEAKKSKTIAENALVQAEKQKKLAIEANKKSEKIIDAFYFYDGKFALAFKYGKFGFIDKEGNVVIEYKYDEALPFDGNTGMAKVKKNGKNYWIDTMANEYLLAEEIYQLTDFQNSQKS